MSILVLWVAILLPTLVIGMQMKNNNADVFVGSQAASPPPGTEPASNEKHFFNGNFELINLTSNGTTVADATMIPNWIPGGAGVQIVQSSTYQMSNYEPGGGVFAIHLNNPTATGNTTQGSLASRNFSWNPEPANLYTVQYDCARLPDGPVNIVPAVKVSSMTGIVTNYFTLHVPHYNMSDTPKSMTWTRKSFVFMGTGANTSLLFESMSGTYGPLIDNVVILKGVHILHDAAPSMCHSIIMRSILTLAISIYLSTSGNLCHLASNKM